MTIQPNSPLDTAARAEAQKASAQRSGSNTSGNSTDSTDSNVQTDNAAALSALAVPETEEGGALDPAGADQLMQSLIQSMAGNLNATLRTHTGLNATSVFDLIQ